ncbi:MAG: indolepyruvate oxidoreductase subunit beta [Desulfotomaculum sp.]|nr:indolepyruvate oxidoreductase subunit beta [Desulfotomaculum sp.]
MKLDIIITGVGGQGNVLSSRILAQAAIKSGLSARTSETIGMAQREGVVMSQVRMGDIIYSPLIPDGEADILLGFELAETVRGLPKLKNNAVVIANQAAIVPVSAALGNSGYQADKIKDYLKEHVKNLYLLDATALAAKAGTYKATNIVLLGALAQLNILPFSKDKLLQVILDTVPSKYKEINIRAFELGCSFLEVM